jgi:predicted MFS family arabinose efflux permease
MALLVGLFTDPAERAKAIGVLGFVCTGGTCVGLVLGGWITNALGWHWIFLINVPIGAAVGAACLVLLPHDGARRKLQRARTPLVPLGLFRIRDVLASNIAVMLLSAAAFGWFFFSALYLQLVLGYDAFEVGLAFLPATVTTAVLSIAVFPRLVAHFGIQRPLVLGLLLMATGMALFARAPIHAVEIRDVLPPMLILGLGLGLAYNPLMLGAVTGVPPTELGAASGIVNTSFMLGGALGLAVLAGIATGRTRSLQLSGVEVLSSLNSGYHAAFVIGAILAASGAVVGLQIRDSR